MKKKAYNTPAIRMLYIGGDGVLLTASDSYKVKRIENEETDDEKDDFEFIKIIDDDDR